MNYRGMMDGWHGDEMECNSSCGTCEQCEQAFDERCDYEYDLWRDEEAA